MIRTANAYLMQAEITQHENCLEFQQFQNRNLVECRQEQKYGVLILSKKNKKIYKKLPTPINIHC